jgi:hydrogenase-1 operon protein HyaF
MNHAEVSRFNIHSGNELTRNVEPILHEIRHALEKLINEGEGSIIDLRSIPLAPGEEEAITQTLGHGEIHTRMDALGPSEIYETRFAGVWMVTHFNDSESIVSRFIEVTWLPDVIESQRDDVINALDRLDTELGVEDT